MVSPGGNVLEGKEGIIQAASFTNECLDCLGKSQVKLIDSTLLRQPEASFRAQEQVCLELSLSLVAMQFMANLHKNQGENSTEVGRKREQETKWVKGKMKQIRVLKVIFLLRLHALTSMGSSTSQKVLQYLAAGLAHSVKS